MNQKGAAPLLILVAIIGVVAFLAISSSAPFKNNLLSSLFPKDASFAAPTTGCDTGSQPASVPGQTLIGAIAGQPYPIWCQNLGVTATDTHTETANSWLDDFNHGASFSSFGTTPSVFQSNNLRGTAAIDGGYVIYSGIDSDGGSGKQRRTQRWRHANHWMTDMTGGFLGGTTMRPNRSFRAENGKIIIETDVAAGVLCYESGCNEFGGDIAWPEIEITTASAPTGNVVDSLYAYGYFGGQWAMGCRLHGTRHPICALQGPSPNFGCPNHDTPDENFCLGNRRWEIAKTEEPSGMTVNSVNEQTGGDNYWRRCVNTDPDTNCRDRFRLEITKTSFVLFVNGKKYLEAIVPANKDIFDLPTGQLFPDEFFNQDIYTYFADWTDTPPDNYTYRFHWDRISINPSTPASAAVAETFCLGQPGNVCAAGTSPTPTPSSTTTPAPSSTSTPTPTPTPTPSPTAVPSAAALGNSQIAPSTDQTSAGEAEVFPFTANQSGSVNKLNLYIDSGNTATNVVIGLYSDSGNSASTLLTKGTITSPAAGTWNSVTVTGAQITAGTRYWIGVLSTSGSLRFRDNASGGVSYTSPTSTLTTLPNTWTNGPTWPSTNISAYASLFSASTPSPSPSSSTKIGDISGPTGTTDGVIDMWDYNQLLTDLINNPRDPNAKGNIDGIVSAQGIAVDIFDYNLLLGNFGK